MKLSKLALAACASLATLAAVETASAKMQHVLLISVDGMHAVDLQRFVAANPNSTLAKLSKTGVTYTEARTPMPSDSFPGILALVTGGHPGSTGVWYDDAFARDLADPKDCKKLGTGVVYDEAIDAEEDKVDTTIDTKKLVLDPTHNCAPVFPHSLLRVNTVFEVAKAAKGTTAWADKHPSYDLLQGPSGSGITDLYTPEIAVGKTADTVEAVIAYEKVKVDAILNQIKGKDHTGTKEQAVPMIFGMNFQAVSVGQKIPSGGYKDAEATPSAALEVGLKSVDAALGQMTAALEAQKLDKDTLVIVTAKHGQSPIDPKLRKIVDKKAFGKVLGAIWSITPLTTRQRFSGLKAASKSRMRSPS